MTDSMKRAINTTKERRELQNQYNKEHGIVPKTIIKDIAKTLEITTKQNDNKKLGRKQIKNEIEKLKKFMDMCVKNLDFESAIKLRDQIRDLTKQLND